jgi:exonuclease VII small subunit
MDSAEVTEIKRHFNVVAERLEGRIQLLAEGIVGLDERLGRFEERVEARFDSMDRRFEETQAMIKFSHAELDRRIRALEEGYASLESRVQRLETR